MWASVVSPIPFWPAYVIALVVPFLGYIVIGLKVLIGIIKVLVVIKVSIL